MEPQFRPDDEASAQDLVRSINLYSLTCRQSHCQILPHEVLIQIALGLEGDSLSIAEQAKLLGQDGPTLLQNAHRHLLARDCYRQAWVWCSARIDFSDSTTDIPPEIIARAESYRVEDQRGTDRAGSFLDSDTQPQAQEYWNAGDLSCGELVLKLRNHLRSMEPGEILQLTSYDVSAREDIPAWCGLTGNRLVAQEHPRYWIERKEE